jgi:2-polyprenyl-6-methoxyphenol hydroxylase-like FAD-dependent oxidoreductase
VLIAGAGPVGTTLALDLAVNGVRSVILEERRDFPPNPKCNTTNARSMEHFRRLGCAAAIRRAGLPRDRATDVVYATRWVGQELTRYRLRSSGDVLDGRGVGAIDEYWPTPEPQHRISQLYMEPVVRSRLHELSACDFRAGWQFLDFAQDHNGIDCRAVEIASGREQRFRAQYLVSCEGGRSRVRREIGARLEGREVVTQFCTTYFRCPGLDAMWPHAPAWMHRIYNRDGESHILAIDGRELWLHHSILGPDADLDAHDHVPAIRSAIGTDIDYEVLGQERWVARAMVVDRYRDRRVFLAGDAAHIWIPMGGFGMNAGIEDAVNLAWKLRAKLQGWGGDRLLDSYGIERRAIGELVAGSAAKIFADLYQVPVGERDYEADSAEGATLRAAIGRRITAQNQSEFDSVGMQLGVSYDDSPVVCYDGAPSPRFAIDRYEESSRPGVRAPHVWRADGSALYDAFGGGYTLLRIGAAPPDTLSLEAAFEARGAPLRVLDVPEAEAVAKYQGWPLVLVRPDQHVGWRGRASPVTPQAVVARLTGTVECGA